MEAITNKQRESGTRLMATTAGLAGVVFIVDLMLPLGVAEWVPYAALVLLSLWSPRRNFALILAAACTLLIILGFLFSPSGGGPPRVDIFNRSLGIVVIWVIGILCVLRLRAEEALRNAHDELEMRVRERTAELERANQLKDEFLGFVSHELKTPVNVIKGYSEILRDKTLGDVNKDQENAIEKIMNNSDDVLNMIYGLLDVERLEAGMVKVENHETDLVNFLDDLRVTHDPLMVKELSLNWDYPSDLPVIRTDGEKLKHILQNLINNAVHYTDKGHITVSVRYSLEAKRLEFKVTDTGVGIPRDELVHIFEVFHQGKNNRPRRPGGVGLGLYIVKNFTELLGGKIEVDSIPGKGSTFRVSLPCEKKSPSTFHSGRNEGIPA